jgi:hypothetical protein
MAPAPRRVIVRSMIRSRLQRRPSGHTAGDAEKTFETRELTGMFAPPTWLQYPGLTAWFLVGLGVALVGTIWLLGQTSSIVEPVVATSTQAAERTEPPMEAPVPSPTGG